MQRDAGVEQQEHFLLCGIQQDAQPLSSRAHQLGTFNAVYHWFWFTLLNIRIQHMLTDLVPLKDIPQIFSHLDCSWRNKLILYYMVFSQLVNSLGEFKSSIFFLPSELHHLTHRERHVRYLLSQTNRTQWLSYSLTARRLFSFPFNCLGERECNCNKG